MALLLELHRAVDYSQFDEVRALINTGADVNAIFREETVFTVAIQARHFDMAHTIMDCIDFNPNARNYWNATPLYLSVMARDARIVERLLFWGADVNGTDHTGYTALMACAQTDDYNIAQTLITHGAYINQPDFMGLMAFHHACFHGAVSVSRLLFALNPDSLNKQCNNWMTPLMYALPSRARSSEISDKLLVSRDLIQAGCNLNMRDVSGRTALHWAVECSDVHGLCLLAESGCELNIRDDSKRTPFHAAILRPIPAFDLARFLLYYGADATEEIADLHGPSPATPLSVVLNFRILPHQLELLWSRDALLKVLHKCVYPYRSNLWYCDINYYTSNNAIPEHKEVYKVLRWLQDTQPCSLQHRTFLKVRKMLGSTNILPKINSLHIPLELKDDLRLALPSNWQSPSEYWNLLLYIETCRNGHVRQILDNGRDIDVEISSKKPLAVALEHRNQGAAIIILDRSAPDSFVVNSTGDTALHVAAEHGFDAMLDPIIRKYPHINLHNLRGQTALHLAIHTGQFTAAAFLINQGAELGTSDSRMSLLHMAAASGAPEVVRLLLGRGMDPDIQDSFQNTPLHVAASKGWLYLQLDIHVPVQYRERDAASRGRGQVRDTEHAEVIRLLVGAGGSLLMVNENSWTPAMYAEVLQHTDLAHLLDGRRLQAARLRV